MPEPTIEKKGWENYTNSGSVEMILSVLMAIAHLIGINGATLVVYRVDEYFQYEIAFLTVDGSLYQPKIYDTAKSALGVKIESIETTIGYQ